MTIINFADWQPPTPPAPAVIAAALPWQQKVVAAVGRYAIGDVVLMERRVWIGQGTALTVQYVEAQIAAVTVRDREIWYTVYEMKRQSWRLRPVGVPVGIREKELLSIMDKRPQIVLSSGVKQVA